MWEIIAWIIFGGLAGWLASVVMGTNKNIGDLANVLVGIAGAFIGGLIMSTLIKPVVTGFKPIQFFGGTAWVGGFDCDF